MIGKITTVLAKKEAEAYRSQGLHQEAARLFSELLSSSPNMNPEIRTALEAQVQNIQSEMADADQQRERPLSAGEIGRIRDGWGDQATETDVLVCAQAFAQIGSHNEALIELQKLLGMGLIKKVYLAAAAESFVQLYPPEKLPDAVEHWTQVTGQPLKAVLAMRLAMARHMEAQGNLHHALVLYQRLCLIPALADRMKQRIDEVTARLNG